MIFTPEILKSFIFSEKCRKHIYIKSLNVIPPYLQLGFNSSEPSV